MSALGDEFYQGVLSILACTSASRWSSLPIIHAGAGKEKCAKGKYEMIVCELLANIFVKF